MDLPWLSGWLRKSREQAPLIKPRPLSDAEDSSHNHGRRLQYSSRSPNQQRQSDYSELFADLDASASSPSTAINLEFPPPEDGLAKVLYGITRTAFSSVHHAELIGVGIPCVKDSQLPANTLDLAVEAVFLLRNEQGLFAYNNGSDILHHIDGEYGTTRFLFSSDGIVCAPKQRVVLATVDNCVVPAVYEDIDSAPSLLSAPTRVLCLRGGTRRDGTHWGAALKTNLNGDVSGKPYSFYVPKSPSGDSFRYVA